MQFCHIIDSGSMSFCLIFNNLWVFISKVILDICTMCNFDSLFHAFFRKKAIVYLFCTKQNNSVMILRTIILTGLLMSFLGCSNTQNKTNISGNINAITVDKLMNDESFSNNQDIAITGTVTHVCRHGGQRMFIIGDDPEKRLKITTGPKISEFQIDLEGREVEIKGKIEIQRIDEQYLNEWEEKVLGSEELQHDEETGIHDGDHSSNLQDELDKINRYREQISASGKNHLSFYSIVCENYEVL